MSGLTRQNLTTWRTETLSCLGNKARDICIFLIHLFDGKEMQIFFCPRHTDVKHPALLLDVLIQHRLLVGHHSLVHVDQIDVFVLKPLGRMQRGKRYALTLLFLALVQAFQFPGVILDVRKPSVIIFIASCTFL